ncbi:MAG: hypothetical protein ACO2ZC_13395, partial [Pseudomonadales bacterium]
MVDTFSLTIFVEIAMSRRMLATLLLALLPWAVPQSAVADSHGDDIDKAEDAIPELLHAESEGKVRIDGRTIEYRATAGTMEMKDDEGEVIAHFGYTAYLKKDGDRRTRPILFAYNGGPGVTAGIVPGVDAPYQPDGAATVVFDAADLITSWSHWLDMPRRVGDRMGAIIGSRPGEVAVHDNTTL